MNIENLQVKLFKNKAAETNPKAPAIKGFLCDPNNNYEKVAELSCWYADDKETGKQKLDKNGQPFLTGKTQAVYVKA